MKTLLFALLFAASVPAFARNDMVYTCIENGKKVMQGSPCMVEDTQISGQDYTQRRLSKAERKAAALDAKAAREEFKALEKDQAAERERISYHKKEDSDTKPQKEEKPFYESIRTKERKVYTP